MFDSYPTSETGDTISMPNTPSFSSTPMGTPMGTPKRTNFNLNITQSSTESGPESESEVPRTLHQDQNELSQTPPQSPFIPPSLYTPSSYAAENSSYVNSCNTSKDFAVQLILNQVCVVYYVVLYYVLYYISSSFVSLCDSSDCLCVL